MWFKLVSGLPKGQSSIALLLHTQRKGSHAAYATTVRLTLRMAIPHQQWNDKHRLGVNLHPRLCGSVPIIARSEALPKELQAHF